MASLLPSLATYSQYKDRYYQEDYERDMERSTTLYVGNLSFYTTEEQIFALFSLAGDIKRIVMGLDRHKKTPCGFCFVEYYRRQDMLDCMKFINGTKLDDRPIRTDIDPGFADGRQYGRGKSGGQVRDEYRADYDEGRGGYGRRGRAYDSMDAPQGSSAYGGADAGRYGNKRRHEDDDQRPYRQKQRRDD